MTDYLSNDYDSIADIYDTFIRAAGKDYALESERIVALTKMACPGGTRLLDVGCGVGGHLEHFASHYDCTGIDLSQDMLDQAQSRVPTATLVRADMTQFALPDRFDVVVSLFGAISHIETVDNMRSTVQCIAEHTSPGGLVAIEPFLQPEAHESGVNSTTYSNGTEFTLIEMEREFVEDGLAVYEADYLIGTVARSEHRTHRLRMAMFTWHELSAAMRDAGLIDVHVSGGDFLGPDTWGVIFGRKPRATN